MNARLVAVDLMVKMGRPDAVRQSLEAIRGDLYDLRKAAGIEVLADCVRDANAAMDALMVYRRPRARLDEAGDRERRRQQGRRYGSVLDRCDGMAADAVRKAGRNSAAWSTAPRPA